MTSSPSPFAQSITLRDAQEGDLPAILDIYNDAILNTTASWSIHAVDLESRRLLLHERQAKGLPFIVAALDGDVIGFASLGRASASR
jgi:phosphinothricin acetyltransferase